MIGFIGYLAALLTTISAGPQLAYILRTRDARGVSIPSWLTLSAGVTLWLVYGLRVGSGPLIVANAISVALDISIVSAVLWIRRTPLPSRAGGATSTLRRS